MVNVSGGECTLNSIYLTRLALFNSALCVGMYVIKKSFKKHFKYGHKKLESEFPSAISTEGKKKKISREKVPLIPDCVKHF